MTVYRFLGNLSRALWLTLGELQVEGLENVPEQGPFILVANHQSILDPILIQSSCPRPLHTMAKSTQFRAPVVGWLMARHLNCFPVRRYELDPQAVRTALRRLREGEGVGIYVEGERSWDGSLQPPRLGAIRLLLKAGVPVIPAVITGSYDAWPRWARGVRSATVRIRFKSPVPLPPAHDRAQRDAVLDDAVRLVMGAIDPLAAA